VSWLVTGSCEAAYRFGWMFGNLTGLLAAVIVVLLIVSARTGGRRGDRVHNFQRALKVAPYALGLAWIVGGFCVHRPDIACYVTTLSFGLLVVLAPLMLLLMVTAAQLVGRASAR